ncbi:unannotated protein [freshwater metagenome]|uniref:Unannotated protein n=1 Tax=freshwater metagenome TaxID=449393 RepID=A0A6J6TFJ3_9ZZZZ
MSRSLGWAMPLPAPTKVAEGRMVSAPADGTPPSPSMNPSPPLSFDIGTIDHFGTADAAGAAAAGTIGRAAPAIEARISPMVSRGRMTPPYVMSGPSLDAPSR